MTRAAFLPSPGDPFVLMHFLHYFKTVWRDEVDRLYISLNSDLDKAIIEEMLHYLVDDPNFSDSKITVILTDGKRSHGWAINRMLDECDQELVVLLEDDSIIFKKGFVTEMFDHIERGRADVIGSPRMSCSPHLALLARQAYGLNYEGWGDKGPNFWPCFFFTKKSILAKTDRNFGNKKWEVGDSVCGAKLTQEAIGDTFVNTSLQIRAAKKYKIAEIPQYHCSPNDTEHQAQGLGIFDGKCGYMHIGSLSSGIENTLLAPNGKPLQDYHLASAGPAKLRKDLSDQERQELIKRLVWWQEGWVLAAKLDNSHYKELTKFANLYEGAITHLMDVYKITHAELNAQRKLYYAVISH